MITGEEIRAPLAFDLYEATGRYQFADAPLAV